MKTTKRNSFAAIAVSALVLGVSSSAVADTVDLQYNTSTYSDTPAPGYAAGEFAASVSSYQVGSTPSQYPNVNIGAYVSGKTSGIEANNLNSSLTTFQTFCLESNVDITLSSYNFVTGLNALKNGGPITVGVAYLYSEFAAGNLNGYTYTLGSGRTASALGLQYTIWMLGQQDLINQSTPITVGMVEAEGGTVFLQDLVTAGLLSSNQLSSALANGTNLATSGALAANAAPQTDNVDAMVIQDGSGNYVQDQLVMTGSNVFPPQALPDGGATVALLGMAFGGLTFFKRKFA